MTRPPSSTLGLPLALTLGVALAACGSSSESACNATCMREVRACGETYAHCSQFCAAETKVASKAGCDSIYAVYEECLTASTDATLCGSTSCDSEFNNWVSCGFDHWCSTSAHMADAECVAAIAGPR